MPTARSKAKVIESMPSYVDRLSGIETQLAEVRRAVNAALLASLDEPYQLRALTKLDNMLADPTQFSHELLRSQQSA